MEYLIRIENFKSIINTSLHLKQGLNILIGPNGAGKTNILNSLKFLKDILMRGVGLAIARGGGPSRNFNRNNSTIRFTIEFDYGNRVFKRKSQKTKCVWIIEIELKGAEKQATISKEIISIYLSELESQRLAEFKIDRTIVGKSTSHIFLDPDNTGKDLFNQFSTRDRHKTKKELYKELEERFKKVFSEFRKKGDYSMMMLLDDIDIKFRDITSSFISLDEYNIIPERARQATEQLPFAKMSPNGFGISEVIEALEKKNFHKIEFSGANDLEFFLPYRISHDYFYPSYFYRRRGKGKEITEALENINTELSAAVKNVSNVTVEIDQTNGRRFVVFKSDTNQKFYPDEVSDGTIKWLCILTGIYVGFSKIFLLEEPENFLHPWMQQKLIQIMREQSKKYKSIFLLTTHSTTLLNASMPEEIITVSSHIDGTISHRIENIDEIESFLHNSEFRLGDLWVSGGIGGIPD